MHIVAFAKVVPDYEVPAGDFELVNGRAHERYTRMMGLYDENAVEVAVQLKEKYSATLTIVSYGPQEDVPVLRKAVAMGGDEMVLVTGASDDPFQIAANLKMAVETIGEVDLLLAGRQSADMDRGVVPGILAGMMGCTFIPQVSRVERTGDEWKVVQITESGTREMEFGGKGLLSITDDTTNVPRIPPVRRILAAKKAPVKKLPEVQAQAMAAQELSVEIPAMESTCEFIPVEDMLQSAQMLLKRLKEERYL